MRNKVYLALYKGRAKNRRERLEDWFIRKITKGIYSHCEIVIEETQFTGRDHYDMEKTYTAYSASPRDGGVRKKVIDVHNGKWDLIPLDISPDQVLRAFVFTEGAKYDYWGAFGVIFKTPQRANRYFCSEWCFNVIFQSDAGWRFSPNDLAELVKCGKNIS